MDLSLWIMKVGILCPGHSGSLTHVESKGECKKVMMDHLRCLTDNKGDNGKCRLEARKYLECRMDQ